MGLVQVDYSVTYSPGISTLPGTCSSPNSVRSARSQVQLYIFHCIRSTNKHCPEQSHGQHSEAGRVRQGKEWIFINQGSTYFWLYPPSGLCCSHSALLLQHETNFRQYISEWNGCFPIKLYLQNQVAIWIWLMGYSFSTLTNLLHQIIDFFYDG